MNPEEKLFQYMLKKVNTYSIEDVKIIATEYGIRFHPLALGLRRKLAIALIAAMSPEEYQKLLRMFR
jgi:hypothetical protein